MKMTVLDTPSNVRAVRRALGLVVAGLTLQLACAFMWSPATFLLFALVGMPLVVVGAALAAIYRARSMASRPEDP